MQVNLLATKLFLSTVSSADSMQSLLLPPFLLASFPLQTEMGKDVNKASKENVPIKLSKAEISEHVKRFNKLDQGRKGYVSLNDIRQSLKVGTRNSKGKAIK